MAKKIIVTVAPTSNFHGKEANPALPIHPDEIAQDAYDCYNAGAAIVHIHARDKDGRQTNDVNVFKEINEKVKAKCNIIQQFSTAPAMIPGTTVDDGLAVLDAGAEMCSLDCGIGYVSYKGQDRFLDWTRKWLLDAAKKMQERNIKPELEIFNHTQLEDVINILMPAGVLNDPPSFNFVLGMNKVNQGAMEYSMENLTHLVRKLPSNALFGAMGIGQNQHFATVASLILGGNVRVGFEDNIYYRKGELAKSNAQLVERIVGVAKDFGYEVATPDEARAILGIKQSVEASQ